MIDQKSLKNLIIYADDDQDDLELVVDFFSKQSEKVELLTMTNGLEVLSFLENLEDDDPAPCLIILDINMPKMNGKETLVEIRQLERFKDIPVIMFTTSSQQIDKQFAKKYNAGFLTKPLHLNQMSKITDIFIDRCHSNIQNQIRKKQS